MSQNLLAVEDLEHDFAPVDVVLVESGGDNLTATFSPALVDAQFFVLDVAGGGDVARKGGPGIAGADVLVVNKTDLAPYVGVDVEQMVADASAGPRRPDGDRLVPDGSSGGRGRTAMGAGHPRGFPGRCVVTRATRGRWRRTRTPTATVHAHSGGASDHAH